MSVNIEGVIRQGRDFIEANGHKDEAAVIKALIDAYEDLLLLYQTETIENRRRTDELETEQSMLRQEMAATHKMLIDVGRKVSRGGY